MNNWKDFLLCEGINHFEVEIYLKFAKDMSLYGAVFNKLRSIDGITIVKVKDDTHVQRLNSEQKSVILDVKFIPKHVSMRTYKQYLKTQILKIKDEEGDAVLGVRFKTMPRATT